MIEFNYINFSILILVISLVFNGAVYEGFRFLIQSAHAFANEYNEQ